MTPYPHRHIDSLNLEIIDVCNLRCKHCDIWMNQTSNRLESVDIEHILSSRYIDPSTDITVTWGEPFLHEDITFLILSVFKKGFCVKTLSTNGTHGEKLLTLLHDIKQNGYTLPSIHISLDGSEEGHDFQRWTPGAFKTVLRNIRLLQQYFPDVGIKIKCTLTKENIADLPFLWHLSKNMGVQFGVKTVENDPAYTNGRLVPSLLGKDEKKHILSALKKLYRNKDPYIDRLSYFLENDTIDFVCTTPETSLFVMSNGRLYCCTKYKSIGNIKETNIDHLLFQGTHTEIILKARETDCRKCFSYHWSYKSIIWTI